MSLHRLRAPLLRPVGARALTSSSPASSSYRSPYDLDSMFEPAPSSSPAPAASRSPTSSNIPAAKNPFAGIAETVTPSAHKASDPDAWWRQKTMDQHGKPGNQFTGRSMPVTHSFTGSYSVISGILKRSGVRDEFRRIEYYEKPSTERVRLNSERQRRRFQENIRKRVQLVEQLRSRK